MASDGKKILMFDESTGMLSKEVMLAYIHGELSPAVLADVENFLANNEMHRDIIEGMRQIPDRNQYERAINSINERVAQRTGAQSKGGSVSLELPVFFTNFRKIAAVFTGILLVSAIVAASIYLLRPSAEIALKHPEDAQNKNAAASRTAPPKQEQQIVAAVQTDSVLSDTAALAVGAEIYQPEESEQFLDTLIADAGKPKLESAPVETRTQAVAKKIAPAQEKTTVAEPPPVTDETTTVTVTGAANGVGADDDKVQQEPAAYSDVQAAKSKMEESLSEPEASVEGVPQFPGGEEALRKYLKDNLKYPQSASGNKIQGNVYLTFTVGTSGRVKDIRVEKGVTKEINAEAIRLVANMPAWKPATQKGKPVAMKRVLIVEFALD